MKIPSDVIELHEAADQYGFSWTALRRAIDRKRLKGFQMGAAWFSTHKDIKKYLDTRETKKIAHRFRKKIVM